MEKKRSVAGEVQVVLDKWFNLQKILKEEITLNEISNKF
jgi:hypothetical protein